MKNNLFVCFILLCITNFTQLSGEISFSNKYATINLSGGSSFRNNSSNLIIDGIIAKDNGSSLLGKTITFSKGNLECENFETANTPVLWQNAPNIVLSSNTTLSNTWYFSGTNKLNGNCHILDLSSNGNLILQPGAKLYINDIHIRGLGDSYNKGRIVFMDDNSQLWFCNASVELVNNITTTIGGIYVNGPTTWILKEHNWRFDQTASLTVDGVTLWKDPAGIVNYGDVKFGAGNEANYLSLIESGTIKALANLDTLSSDTTYLLSISPLMFDYHYVFAPGSSTIGSRITWFKKGFTLPAGATVFIEDPIFIFGPIILNNTGILHLDNNIYLSSDFTFTSGGIISGNGFALNLDGNITLTDDNILTFSTDTILDGHGHKFIFGNNAQLLIDSNVTLTIRNMTFKNTFSAISKMAIRCLDWYGKLVLENVKFEFNDDFEFNMGQLFINNDVIITGTSKFIYTSVLHSYICQHSCLYFDYGTTFFYAPATTDKNLIVMIDNTSDLYLNGATLQTTHTGLRLTKGSLFLDNDVTLSSAATLIFSGLGTEFSMNVGRYVRSVDWHPNGKHLAVGGNATGDDLRVYNWNGTSLSQITSTLNWSVINTVAWDPLGKFLAVGGGIPGNDLRIYSWDGSNLTQLDSALMLSTVRSVAWSPDGKFLTVGGGILGNDLRIYSWDGSNLNQIYSTLIFSNIRAVNWSPDGKYVVAGGGILGNDLRIYSWNGSSLSQIISTLSSSNIYTAVWNPNGKYLAIGGEIPGDNLRIYSWNGTTLTQIESLLNSFDVQSVAWSPNGKYLAMTGDNGPKDLRIYDWNGSNLTELTSRQYGSQGYSVAWSPDSQFLAVGADGSFSMPDDLFVYPMLYIPDATPLTVSNAVTFGDSAKGLSFDLNVFLLSGAFFDIYGMLYNDNLM